MAEQVPLFDINQVVVSDPNPTIVMAPRQRGQLCRHGSQGYCHDDATPEQREYFEGLYRHAFDWASSPRINHLGGNLPLDEAEEYASWYAGEYWDQRPTNAPAHGWAYANIFSPARRRS